MSINNNEEVFLKIDRLNHRFCNNKIGELVELITISALVKRVGNDSYNLRQASLLIYTH